MKLKQLKNKALRLIFGKKNDNDLPGYIKVYRDQPSEEEVARQ